MSSSAECLANFGLQRTSTSLRSALAAEAVVRWADGGLTVIGKDLTKSQRRRLSELAALAYQRELDAELGKLETEFRRWRSGELSPHELSDLIHAFHNGPSRELFSRYDRRFRDFAVVDAVRRGVLSEAEVGSEILSLLASQLSVTD
jgi:hypothetical protein